MDDVAPFVENVTGRKLPPERLAATENKYRLIGGCSPLRKTSEAQSRLIEQKLRLEFPDLKVYLGMRYWHPLTSEIIKQVLKDGAKEIVLLCLSPYYSYATSREYITNAIKDIQAINDTIEINEIDSWNEEPALIEGFAEELAKAVSAAEKGAPVVFTAHSIPLDMVDSGDPYPGQIAKTAALTAAAVGLTEYRLGWQSEGRGRGEWLKPTVPEVFEDAKNNGAEEIVIMPIGFTADHVETLYDIDIEMKSQAAEAGLEFSRACCLNTDDSVIDAMISAIRGALRKPEGEGN